MARSESYNTKQKDVILNAIKHQRQEFTIKDIYSQVKDTTGLTTVYRLVDKLVQDGRLNKYISTENITYYQYLEECCNDNHFFLKCENCGTMFHVDCDCIDKISNHIKNNHKFKLNKKNIIITGICDECINKGDNNDKK